MMARLSRGSILDLITNKNKHNIKKEEKHYAVLENNSDLSWGHETRVIKQQDNEQNYQSLILKKLDCFLQ